MKEQKTESIGKAFEENCNKSCSFEDIVSRTKSKFSAIYSAVFLQEVIVTGNLEIDKAAFQFLVGFVEFLIQIFF